MVVTQNGQFIFKYPFGLYKSRYLLLQIIGQPHKIFTMDDDIWDDNEDYEKDQMEREWNHLRKQHMTISYIFLNIFKSLTHPRRIS